MCTSPCVLYDFHGKEKKLGVLFITHFPFSVFYLGHHLPFLLQGLEIHATLTWDMNGLLAVFI
jgi:hypothetical protein